MHEVYNLNNYIQNLNNIEFKENIRIISDDTLKDILGFGKFIKDYEYIQEMVKYSFNSNPHLEEIIKLWDNSRRFFDFLSHGSMLGWNYFDKYFNNL